MILNPNFVFSQIPNNHVSSFLINNIIKIHLGEGKENPFNGVVIYPVVNISSNIYISNNIQVDKEFLPFISVNNNFITGYFPIKISDSPNPDPPFEKDVILNLDIDSIKFSPSKHLKYHILRINDDSDSHVGNIQILGGIFATSLLNSTKSILLLFPHNPLLNN